MLKNEMNIFWQMQLNNVSKELLEIKDSSSILRRRLAEMMNSLLSDLVSVNVDTS